MTDALLKVLEQEPPHNIEAEQALIGAILVNNRAYDAAAETGVHPDHFADSNHGTIYRLMGEMIESGQTANPVTMKGQVNQLPWDGEPEGFGGQYLAKLATAVVTVVNTADFAKAILDTYRRRRLLDVAQTIALDAVDYSLPADGTMSDALLEMDELAGVGARKGELEAVGSAVEKAMATIEAAAKGETLPGVSTGLERLDEAMGQLRPQELFILAGRTSMGKTAVGLRIARNAARAGKSVAFFSLEMPSDQLAQRLLAAETGVSQTAQIRGAGRDQTKMLSLVNAARDVSDLPLHIDQTGQISPREVRRRAQRVQRRQGLDLIVIDYLQLMEPDNPRRWSGNRVGAVTEISGALKAIAKELDIPVIALSQLSRGVEQRDDKRPMLSDLRDSGSIEQDADVVAFTYREIYYLERAEPKQRAGEDASKFADRLDLWKRSVDETRDTVEIIVAKRRAGPVGSVKLKFIPSTGVLDHLDSEGGLV